MSMYNMLATAATTVDAVKETSTISSLSNMLGGLVLVVLLIFVLAYLVKRFNLAPSSQGVLKTITMTPLGQKEKLVLIELEGQQYLLGVTPHSINLIDKLEEPVNIESDSFASRLRQAKSSQ